MRNHVRLAEQKEYEVGTPFNRYKNNGDDPYKYFYTACHLTNPSRTFCKPTTEGQSSISFKNNFNIKKKHKPYYK